MIFRATPSTASAASQLLPIALQHHQAGRLQEAETIYQEMLRIAPSHQDALHLSGLIAYQSGKNEVAVELINKAISIKPSSQMYYNLGNAFQNQGSLDAAVDSFRKALTIKPDYPQAQNNLGNALQAQGNLSAAIESYRRALSLKVDYAHAHYNLGGILFAQGEIDTAVEHYQMAVSIQPDYAKAHYSLGNIFQTQSKLDVAATHYRLAILAQPDYAEARSNLGYTLHQQGKLDEAMSCLQQAQSHSPTHFEWKLRTLGVLMPSLADSPSHLSMLRDRLKNNIQYLLEQEGSVHDLENVPFNLFGLAYHGADDKPLMEQIAKLVRAKAPALAKSLAQQPPSLPDNERIKVGFISSLFYSHTIGKLTQGYIRNLDRSRFHVTVIHAPGGKNDFVRNTINDMADAVVYLPPILETAQEVVADLKLHILHYPDIGMIPFTVFLAYSRLAPVQTVSWGHPVTTGLDTIDYFLSFDAAEPQDAEKHYTENLVRLSRAPVHYDPFSIPAQSTTRSELGLPESGNLYGCLQSLFKFHPDFDAVLAGIAARDPQGWIIAIGSEDSHLRHQLHKRWLALYPALLERVVFLPPQPMHRFLMLLTNMDVLLDTPHFGSGNTLYESMIYGIPIITWPGDFMRGRLVAGVYKWLGVTDAPIAATLDDYAALAVDFATDHTRRNALQRQLIEKSPALYQDKLAVNELEAFFEQALAAAQRGEKLRQWSSGLPWPAQQNFYNQRLSS